MAAPKIVTRINTVYCDSPYDDLPPGMYLGLVEYNDGTVDEHRLWAFQILQFYRTLDATQQERFAFLKEMRATEPTE